MSAWRLGGEIEWLAQMEARRLVLSLREMLVRHDENIAANTLMQECVPFICEGDPELERARAEQALKVRHITHPEDYEPYYANNHHEKSFEEQYLQEPEEAHEHIYRVEFLREWLAEQEGLTVLDISANDGWMAQNLAGLERDPQGVPVLTYHGIDLNPHCIERARGRAVPRARFWTGFGEEAEKLTRRQRPKQGYDAVIAYELVEHVRDPDALLSAMVRVCKPGGSLFISTPLGACTGGDLPRWWVVEPAGHVRAYTPRSFAALLRRHGECEGITVSDASQGRLMVARVTVPGIVAADEHQLRADRARAAGAPRPPQRPLPAERPGGRHRLARRPDR